MENRVREVVAQSGLSRFHRALISEWVLHQLRSVVTVPGRNGDILHSPTHKQWILCRELMSGVTRWGGFVKKYGVWQQTTLQHTDGVHFLVVTSSRVLRRTGESRVDYEKMPLAFKVHDAGEGLLKLKNDVMLNHKTAFDSVLEYGAFRKAFGRLVGFEELYHPAYLLQHCLDREEEKKHFPQDAQVMIQKLLEENPLNALFFKWHEWFDYVLYAAWQFIDRGNRDVMANVMRNCDHKLTSAVENRIPGLGATLWTSEFRNWCLQAAEGGDPNPPEA